MEKPKIKIKGKEYEAIEPKGKTWRKITELDENKKDIPNVEYLERHAEIITEYFPKVKAEEILEELEISEVIKLFYDCYKYTTSILYSKLKKLDSTEGGGE